MFTDPLFLPLAALLGAIVGSFLNVVILRLPDEQTSIAYPASHCPQCQHPLAWFDNIPVLSYLWLRGKCRYCQKDISLQYPAIELLMAFFSAAIVYRFGLTVESAGFFLLIAALLVITVIDLHLQIIPDVISLPGIIVGLLFSFFSSHITWLDSLGGILLGGGVLYTVALVYFLIRKQDGMGGGDIKLLAMLGAFLGWQSLPFIILASSLAGSVIGITAIVLGQKDAATRIPFGPYLAGAAIIYLFYSEPILWFFQAYLHGEWP